MMFVCLVFQTVGVVKCWTILSKEVAESLTGSLERSKMQQDTALHSQKDLEQAVDTLSIISGIKTEGSFFIF